MLVDVVLHVALHVVVDVVPHVVVDVVLHVVVDVVLHVALNTIAAGVVHVVPAEYTQRQQLIIPRFLATRERKICPSIIIISCNRSSRSSCLGNADSHDRVWRRYHRRHLDEGEEYGGPTSSRRGLTPSGRRMTSRRR